MNARPGCGAALEQAPCRIQHLFGFGVGVTPATRVLHHLFEEGLEQVDQFVSLGAVRNFRRWCVLNNVEFASPGFDQLLRWCVRHMADRVE